ncbi:hypothetical protein [Promicromonospora soli]|uniref:Uncharacterized protein n=1 Tax=Promicromonospora soli TaxID=2035533 RepID=A0A919FIN8_9MICO|nr:hypothetical protein [Promicromonospora soli]GHH66493.1 hypothetical protein GCM10017772_06510 [Promicromonospora soli]
MRPDRRRPWLGTVEMRTYLSVDREFVPIEEAPVPKHWSGYEGGAVQLVINGRSIIRPESWDDIEPLWMLLAGLVTAIGKGASYATASFPDQPIPVGIALQADDLVVVVCGRGQHRRRAVADKRTFFEAFCRAGIDAFDQFERLGGGQHAALARQSLVECLDDLYQGEWPNLRTTPCIGVEKAAAAEREAKAFFGVQRLSW